MNNKDKSINKFSEDLFKNQKKESETSINKETIIERPQTTQVDIQLSRNFEKLYEEIDKLEGMVIIKIVKIFLKMYQMRKQMKMKVKKKMKRRNKRRKKY